MPTLETQDGPIPYVLRAGRRRSLTVRVSPDGSVIVSAPRLAPAGAVRAFLARHSAWIRRHLERWREWTAKYPAKRYVDGERFLVDGRDVRLRLGVEHSLSKITVALQGDELVLQVPPGTEARHLRAALETWYRRRALEYAQGAALRLGGPCGIVPARLALSGARTRWGSCSARGSLRLNWRLAMTPPPVFDYVVAHELAHLRQAHHQREFWALVERLLPAYRSARAWLANHHGLLRA